MNELAINHNNSLFLAIWNPKGRTRHEYDSLSHASKFKANEDKMEHFNSKRCKTQEWGMKDGTMMIPSNYYPEDDTYLLDFIAL
jgi:hypothetical protein